MIYLIDVFVLCVMCWRFYSLGVRKNTKEISAFAEAITLWQRLALSQGDAILKQAKVISTQAGLMKKQREIISQLNKKKEKLTIEDFKTKYFSNDN